MAVGQALGGSDYIIYRSFLIFDTSSIPDTATIDSAVLSLYVWDDESLTDFNVTVQDGQPTYPHYPIEAGDYYQSHYSGNGGSRSTSEIAGAGYWNITLNSDGYDMITVNGYTKLCLRSSRDINSDTPGLEYVAFYETEKGASYEAKLYITYSIGVGDTYDYTFYGPFDEETGYALDENVTVSVYRLEGQPYETFEFNGTTTYQSTFFVQYFQFNFSDGSSREYWVDPSESETATIYIFKGETTPYILNFMDTTGLLSTYPYITVKRYVNGTLYTIEKRKVDAYKSVLVNLVYGKNYQIILGNQDVSYIFGDLTTTSITGIQLVLRAVDFPSESLNFQDNIRLYISRDIGNNTITVNYADASELTNSVDIFFFYNNGSNAFAVNVVSNSFSYIWESADENTDYQAKIYIHHETYGDIEYAQYLSGVSPLKPALLPFSLGFLGDWGFDSSAILPIFAILCVAGCFSKLNAEVGAILACIVAIILTAAGFIMIPVGLLVASTFLAVLFALVIHKRRG